MSKRNTIANQTERVVGSNFTKALRAEPQGTRMWHLLEGTVQNRDELWFSAYEEEEQKRARYVRVSHELREEVAALMTVARRFFRGVYDQEGHSVPRVLAQCMNGSTPTTLERASVAERVRALTSLIVALRAHRELHYDAGVLGELTVAVQAAAQKMQHLDLARRAWRGSVNRKQETAADFDLCYRALVTAARIIGFGDELPVFVDQESPDTEEEDPTSDIEAPAVVDDDTASEE